MKKGIAALFLILLCHLSNALATVTTQLESSQVAVGDNFHVNFTVDNDATDVTPDFTPLKPNFEILGTSKSTQISIINGRSSVETTWGVILNAKHAGTLTIPALNFGKEKSNPQKIQVSNSPITPTSNSQAAKVFLETTADNLHPYVQSQVIYTVKLYSSQRLSSGAVSAPTSTQAVITPLGKSRQLQEHRNGVSYQVWEQDYAVFPQQSGTISIKPPVFNGSIIDTRSRDFDQLLFAVQQPLRAHGKTIELDVAPIPSSYTGKQWTPARELLLTESWQDMEKKPEVGQPISREIVIKARGLNGSQLPDVPSVTISGINSYPEKAIVHNHKTSNEIIGERHISITYIPTQAGDITLPEITIPWWNTQTHSSEIAKLPAHTIKIFPTAAKKMTPPTPPVMNAITNPVTTPVTPTMPRWPWIIALSCLVLWLVTLYIWRVTSKKQISSPAMTINSHENKEMPTNKELRQQLHDACINNQAKLAQELLLKFARVSFPHIPFNNLKDLSKCYNNSEFIQALEKLNASLYSRNLSSWDGESFWKIFQAQTITTKVKINKPGLPPLNPDMS